MCEVACLTWFLEFKTSNCPKGKNPLPGDEEWVNLKYKMNVELLTATEDECESTEAEKGCGRGLWNRNDF
jgi:hypothetical protein